MSKEVSLVKKNPYRSYAEEFDVCCDKVFVDVLAEKVLGRNGLMFKLFDLGNWGLDQNKVLVYKNKIGAEIRKFVKGTPTRADFDRNVEELEQAVVDIGKLSFGQNVVGFEGFVNDVKRLISQLVAEVISAYNMKVMEFRKKNLEEKSNGV